MLKLQKFAIYIKIGIDIACYWEARKSAVYD